MPTTHALRLTPRDWQFLGELAETTVLSADQIRRRQFPDDTTGKSCLRRLRYLTAARLVTPVAVTACFGPKSDRHTIYRLSPFGADVLARRSGSSVRTLRTDPKPDTLLHRVLVARTVLAINDGAAAAGLPHPLWLLEHDRWPDSPRNVPEPEQYRLAADFFPIVLKPDRLAEQYGPPVYDDPKVRLVKARPDAACLLTVPAQATPLGLFFEIDNGTETHGQLLAKLAGYHAILTRPAHHRPWRDLTDASDSTPRILFVFAGEDRMKNVLDRLAADPTLIWVRPYPFQPTTDDLRRATTFLDQFFRFAALTDVEKTDGLRLPMWHTVRRPHPADRLAIVRTTMRTPRASPVGS